jgi:hypothetical protein
VPSAVDPTLLGAVQAGPHDPGLRQMVLKLYWVEDGPPFIEDAYYYSPPTSCASTSEAVLAEEPQPAAAIKIELDPVE